MDHAEGWTTHSEEHKESPLPESLSNACPLLQCTVLIQADSGKQCRTLRLSTMPHLPRNAALMPSFAYALGNAMTRRAGRSTSGEMTVLLPLPVKEGDAVDCFPLYRLGRIIMAHGRMAHVPFSAPMLMQHYQLPITGHRSGCTDGRGKAVLLRSPVGRIGGVLLPSGQAPAHDDGAQQDDASADDCACAELEALHDARPQAAL